MREITFDIETTGLKPEEGHRVVEIGCVELIDKTRTGKVYQAYVNPEMQMPKGAYAVHGLSDEFLSTKPIFKDVVDSFLEFIGNDVDTKLIAHNASFDMKFINYELEKHGYEKISMARSIDSLQIARKKYPGQKASLDALCKKFDIDLSGRDKHGALLDADLLAEVYINLNGGNQNSLDFTYKKEEKNTVIFKEKTFRQPRKLGLPSDEELKNHENFIKSIVN